MECSRNREDKKLVLNFLFFFPDMYVHAYSKASYQTPLNLQELQIISGTSSPNSDQETDVSVKSGNRTKEEQKKKNPLVWGRLQHGAIIHPQCECSFNDRQGPQYHPRDFYLPGRDSPEQWRQALKW